MVTGSRRPPRAWQVLESHYICRDPWLRLRSDILALPDDGGLSSRHVFEYPDWVDVIALTAAFNIVLVDQYRHAVGEIRTEFPAGGVDPAEAPLDAIKRELLEETGYACEEWRPIGSAPVNPVVQTNRIHSFLALDARRVAEQDLDEGEVIQVREMPFAEFVGQVEAGGIELPALQLGGLFWLQSYLRRSADPRLVALRF